MSVPKFSFGRAQSVITQPNPTRNGTRVFGCTWLVPTKSGNDFQVENRGDLLFEPLLGVPHVVAQPHIIPIFKFCPLGRWG